ncbi:MAG: biotin/lipoyl-containing protein [Candidatus Aminicenantales bacterium]
MNLTFWLKGKEYTITLKPQRGQVFFLSHEGKTYEVTAEFITEEEILLRVDGRVYNTIVQSNSSGYSVIIGDKKYLVEKKASAVAYREEKLRIKKREVKISMPGKVVAVLVENGTEVKQGQPVLILEAMKMQNEIKAPQAGKVANLKVKPGETVEAGSVLFAIE